MSTPLYPVAVIGGGSAGVMAVLRTVLNNDQCLFFPGSAKDRKRSRAMWVRKIENMPAHFSYERGIDQPNNETLEWIGQSKFADNLHHMKNTGVESIKRDAEGTFHLTDHKGNVHQARYVIFCTGVMDVQPLIGGDIAPIFPYANLQTVDYCLRCDGHHIKDKATAIIGHTKGAAWVAIMLYERYRPDAMYILLHGQASQFDPETQELLDMYGIKVHAAEVSKVLGDPKKGMLTGFRLADGTGLHAQMAFVSLGMLVYNDLAKQLDVKLDERGFVVADAQGLTSVPGFYVAGDVMAGTKKQIYTAWDTAVNAADAINMKLRSARRAEDLKQFRKI